MKAMMLHHPGMIKDVQLKCETLDIQEPKESEILIRVKFCAVCRTDSHLIEGDLPVPELPIIPGHQVVGIIEETGDCIDEFKKGERVGVPWMSSTCCRCGYCRGGTENLCDHAQFTGLDRHGGYAEYITALGQFVYKLSDEIADHQAAPLLCSGIIGYRSLILCGLRSGQKLVIFGFGASAHIII